MGMNWRFFSIVKNKCVAPRRCGYDLDQKELNWPLWCFVGYLANTPKPTFALDLCWNSTFVVGNYKGLKYPMTRSAYGFNIESLINQRPSIGDLLGTPSPKDIDFTSIPKSYLVGIAAALRWMGPHLLRLLGVVKPRIDIATRRISHLNL